MEAGCTLFLLSGRLGHSYQHPGGTGLPLGLSEMVSALPVPGAFGPNSMHLFPTDSILAA